MDTLPEGRFTSLLAFICLSIPILVFNSPHLRGAADAPSEMMELAPRSIILDAQVVGSMIVAVGERGHILISKDDGLTWKQNPTPTRSTLTAVYFSDASEGWAVGHDGIILHTSNGGDWWTKANQEVEPQTSYLDVYFIDRNRGFIVGAYGEFRRTDDGGKTWKQEWISEEELHFNRISAGEDGYVYLAGESGTLMQSIDQGQTWQVLQSPYYGSSFGVLSIDKSTLLLYGLRGVIYRTEDRADSWILIENEVKALISSGLMLRSGVIVLAGQGGNLFVSRDLGKTFDLWKQPTLIGTTELAETPLGYLLAVGVNGVHRLEPPSLVETLVGN